MDWTEKYRPTTKQAVRGNDSARDDLWEWAATWDEHRTAVLVHGSPGIGKTSAAHALASDMGWERVELNASDQRTADAIERYAGRAARNATLAGSVDPAARDEPDRGRQLVIIDEADNIHGTYDRGGAAAVTALVKEASQPIVLIANDLYDVSRGLRGACETIQFRDVSARSIVPVLRNICRQEGIEFEAEALETIAQRNDGDLRGAVGDLQAVADGVDHLAADAVEMAERDRTNDIFTFLDAVLKEESAEGALRTAYDTDETPDDLLQWVEDKVALVYEPTELSRAYAFLAAADRWLGRVRATQTYRYWRYATDDLAAGVAAVRDHDRSGWTRYGGAPYRSSRDATRDYVARQLAAAAGTSTATARSELLPYLAAMTHHCTNRELTVAMVAAFDLEPEHVSFVTGSGADTNKVQSIVADAEQRRADAAVEQGGELFAPGPADATTAGDDGTASPSTDQRPPDRPDDQAENDQQSGLGDFG